MNVCCPIVGKGRKGGQQWCIFRGAVQQGGIENVRRWHSRIVVGPEQNVGEITEPQMYGKESQKISCHKLNIKYHKVINVHLDCIETHLFNYMFIVIG